MRHVMFGDYKYCALAQYFFHNGLKWLLLGHTWPKTAHSKGLTVILTMSHSSFTKDGCDVVKITQKVLSCVGAKGGG